MTEMETKLLSQHIDELEFRVRTLEQAVLQSGNRIATLENFMRLGANRLVDAIVKGEKETKQ